VHWHNLKDETLSVYAQSESAYLPVGGNKEVRLPVWTATPGNYLAKVFITVKGSAVRDTIRRHFVVLPVGLAESGNEPLPTEYSLDIVSPNPSCDGRLTIRYSVPQAGPVSIKLYDATGRVVRTLLEGRQPAGRYSFIVQRSSLRIPPGVYFIRLTSPNCEKTRKAVVQ
jgi:hypothetical protein